MDNEVKYLDYYDEDLDINIELLTFHDDVSEDEIQIKYRDEVQRASAKSLDLLANNNFDYIPCFVIDDSIFEITKDGYEDHLNNCLEYFKDIEDYEMCSKLISINEKLKS